MSHAIAPADCDDRLLALRLTWRGARRLPGHLAPGRCYAASIRPGFRHSRRPMSR